MGLSPVSLFGNKPNSPQKDGVGALGAFSASRIRYGQMANAQKAFYDSYKQQLKQYTDQYKLYQSYKQAGTMNAPAGVEPAFGGMPHMQAPQPPVWDWENYGQKMEEANKLPWFAQPD